MPSVLRDDKLGTLQHSGGNITLGPSTLTIGGKQQKTTSTLTVPVGNPGAFALVFIYATLDGSGDAQLELSTNVNSIGPGSDSWKLVGAFYTNSSSAFGTFVTIEGAPTSGVMTELNEWEGATSAPGKGGNITIDYVRITRQGSLMNVVFAYKHQTAGTSGVGDLEKVIPMGLNHSEDVGDGSNPAVGYFAFGASGADTNTGFPGNVATLVNTRRLTFYDTESNNKPSAASFNNNFYVISGHYSINILEWDNTPLKDL